METIQAILLGLIQGLTEFLPISSSAHLILLSEISGWEDQGHAFDVALHFGTLLAVLFYFKNDLFNMFARSNFQSTNSFIHSQLGIITIATIPVVLFGVLFNDTIEQNLRSSMVVAIANNFLWLTIILSRFKEKEEK